ncbi:MAG: hypothetical protein A3G41_00380 [Elusimicrobia bacterium RIFCSPLOWO2_12_FULL_59_9]|nr:MAG: hypothetical protein A3G41_00380 [Elusimicrobia bacterium RIFCSPLOWO2_12_FULL_59_9]
MRIRTSGLIVLLLAGLSLAACGGKEESPSPKNPAASAKAVPPFYYDLGSPTVDVSGYPENQKANYRFFLGVCGSCHTTARPLNSPYMEADVWKRYVRRMHLKMKGRGIELSKADEERIMDFLTYDSKVRKILKQGEFQAQQEKLKDLFANQSRPPNPD